MDSLNTEHRILQAAETEFLRNGYAATRTTAIAEAAGVTHAMLHYYFRSKDKLFENIVKEKIGLMGEMMLGSIGTPGKPLFERLENAICRHLDFLAANPDLPRFFIVEIYSQSERLNTAVEAIMCAAEKVIAVLQEEIDALAARGECRRVKAEMLLLDIISLDIFSFIGAPIVERVLCGLFEHGNFLEERKRENIDTIMRKLKP